METRGRDATLGTKVVQIGPKWDKSNTFSHPISAKMYWNLIWKSRGFVPRGPMWPTLCPKPTSVMRGIPMNRILVNKKIKSSRKSYHTCHKNILLSSRRLGSQVPVKIHSHLVQRLGYPHENGNDKLVKSRHRCFSEQCLSNCIKQQQQDLVENSVRKLNSLFLRTVTPFLL